MFNCIKHELLVKDLLLYILKRCVAFSRAYIEESKARLEPMVVNIQEQLKPFSGNMEEQFKPLADTMQAQLSSYSNLMQSQVEDLFKFVVDQTKAILPPQ